MKEKVKHDAPIEPFSPEGNDQLAAPCQAAAAGQTPSDEPVAPAPPSAADAKWSLLKAIEYWVLSRG